MAVVQPLDKYIELVKVHRPRKLRILIANSDSFTQMIVLNQVETLPYIEMIDLANNGQEVLDMIIQKENQFKNYHKAYDIILLDLKMPIKNGFEACRMILGYYEKMKTAQEQAQQEVSQWERDLVLLMNDCMRSLDNEKNIIFNKVYERLKYNALNKLERPLLVAYANNMDE